MCTWVVQEEFEDTIYQRSNQNPANQRMDNTMAKRKEQTTIYKTYT